MCASRGQPAATIRFAQPTPPKRAATVSLPAAPAYLLSLGSGTSVSGKRPKTKSSSAGTSARLGRSTAPTAAPARLPSRLLLPPLQRCSTRQARVRCTAGAATVSTLSPSLGPSALGVRTSLGGKRATTRAPRVPSPAQTPSVPIRQTSSSRPTLLLLLLPPMLLSRLSLTHSTSRPSSPATPPPQPAVCTPLALPACLRSTATASGARGNKTHLAGRRVPTTALLGSSSAPPRSALLLLHTARSKWSPRRAG
mmetsp:Transcript_42810/g.83912  ORF Transcript_42810/g.83912 Transcript_42810/m.83912 type:complete len:253 (+) Transcript_42810:3821-4579(+)